jgi:hypothetical protein
MHRSVKQLNNQLDFLLMCFVAVFDSNYVVLFWAAGAGLRRRSRYVTRLCVRPIFISKESDLLSHFNWLIVGCFTKCFLPQFLFVFVVDHFEMWLVREDDANGAAM